MSTSATSERSGLDEELRQQIASILNEGKEPDGDDPFWAVAAKQPTPAGCQAVKRAGTQRAESNTAPPEGGPFVPRAPHSLGESGLTEGAVEALILKFLLNRGTATGSEIAEQLKLPLSTLADLLRDLKGERLVVYKAAATLTDYLYELTELGVDRARRYSSQCTYFGTAPVAFEHYVASVAAQSLTHCSPKFEDVRRAFADLLLGDDVLSQLGEAANSGRGLFLYGAPGNGKTSIASRITRAFGQGIWIPRSISVLGELIRLYDPTCHEALPLADALHGAIKTIDRRWIYIRRPTIVAGGELTLDNLELTTSSATGISEAPLQLKSNCGTLVIDDFGRQRISPAQLLNRWIVPLETRHDFLDLPSGRKIQVPFDQLVVFSTNLEPRDLVDEAFLRRIPYKVDVGDPTEREFRDLFLKMAELLEVAFCETTLDHLLAQHYRAAGRPLRYCHPRDLLPQVRNFCRFHDRPPAMDVESIDRAVKNYFGLL